MHCYAIDYVAEICTNHTSTLLALREYFSLPANTHTRLSGIRAVFEIGLPNKRCLPTSTSVYALFVTSVAHVLRCGE